MQWLLLNQLFVSLDYKNFGISVFEEVVSSDQQLVQVLVSGSVSHKTMSSVSPEEDPFNQIDLKEECLR